MRSHEALVVAAASLLFAGPTAAGAGTRTPMGSVIEDVELATAAGGKAQLLGSSDAHVLLFFRPDQPNHAGTLKGLAACERELAGKPVRWVALVPERFSAEQAKAAADAAGLKMPVLIDAADAVYGRLGVAMHPTVAVLDKEHRLAQFQPFTSVSFCDAVLAKIRRVMGEIDDAELARALDPSAEQPKGESSASRRDLKLAEMLLARGNLDKALEMARTGAANDPKSAAAQALIGRILVARGDCAGALAAFEASLKLDPHEERAQAGKKACAGKK